MRAHVTQASLLCRAPGDGVGQRRGGCAGHRGDPRYERVRAARLAGLVPVNRLRILRHAGDVLRGGTAG